MRELMFSDYLRIDSNNEFFSEFFVDFVQVQMSNPNCLEMKGKVKPPKK